MHVCIRRGRLNVVQNCHIKKFFTAVSCCNLDGLTAHNHDLAVAIASIPEHIRGYGHVKDEHLEKAEAEKTALLRAFRDPNAPQAQAAQ